MNTLLLVAMCGMALVASTVGQGYRRDAFHGAGGYYNYEAPERPDPFEAPEAPEAPEVPDWIRYGNRARRPGSDPALDKAYRDYYTALQNLYRLVQAHRLKQFSSQNRFAPHAVNHNRRTPTAPAKPSAAPKVHAPPTTFQG